MRAGLLNLRRAFSLPWGRGVSASPDGIRADATDNKLMLASAHRFASGRGRKLSNGAAFSLFRSHLFYCTLLAQCPQTARGPGNGAQQTSPRPRSRRLSALRQTALLALQQTVSAQQNVQRRWC